MQRVLRTKNKAPLLLLTTMVLGAASAFAQDAASAGPDSVTPTDVPYIAPVAAASVSPALAEAAPEEGAPVQAEPPDAAPPDAAPAPNNPAPAQEPPAEAPANGALGTATADFDNLRPDKNETAWGRFVADALLEAGKADVALVNASTLHRGTLKAGPVETASVEALLSFGDDEVVTISITGDQLRAALERAAQSYPTASPAFLHCAGLLAQFNAQAPLNRRVTLVRFKGREVENTDTLSVAMPISLAEGAAGYFTIWNSQGAAHSNLTVRDAVIDFIKSKKEITPDPTPRFSAQ